MRTYVVCLIAFLSGVGLECSQAKNAGKPLPLDPLTPEETATAQRIAQSDPRVGELLGAQSRIVYVLSIAPKLTPQDDEPRGRYADLLFIRGDNESGVHVLVDLVAGRVVHNERVAASSVPLGRADVAEALRIATESQEIRGLLGARAGGFRVLTGPIGPKTANSDYVEGLRHTGGPEDPCARHRCVYLLFNSGGRRILEDREVVVDLNSRQVRSYTIEREGGHR